MLQVFKASLFGLLLVPATLAFRAAARPIDVESASRLWVKGTSTVRAFECQAPVFNARIGATASDAVAAVLAGEKGIESASLSIPSSTLDCHNGTMTGHMRKAIKATEFDSITFTVKDYTLATVDGVMNVALRGALVLGGVTKDIAVDAAAKPGPDGTLQVTGTYALLMSDFGLKPPSLMLGRIKVHDKVTVGFDFLLRN